MWSLQGFGPNLGAAGSSLWTFRECKDWQGKWSNLFLIWKCVLCEWIFHSSIMIFVLWFKNNSHFLCQLLNTFIFIVPILILWWLFFLAHSIFHSVLKRCLFCYNWQDSLILSKDLLETSNTAPCFSESVGKNSKYFRGSEKYFEISFLSLPLCQNLIDLTVHFEWESDL